MYTMRTGQLRFSIEGWDSPPSCELQDTSSYSSTFTSSSSSSSSTSLSRRAEVLTSSSSARRPEVQASPTSSHHEEVFMAGDADVAPEPTPSASSRRGSHSSLVDPETSMLPIARGRTRSFDSLSDDSEDVIISPDEICRPIGIPSPITRPRPIGSGAPKRKRSATTQPTQIHAQEAPDADLEWLRQLVNMDFDSEPDVYPVVDADPFRATAFSASPSNVDNNSGSSSLPVKNNPTVGVSSSYRHCFQPAPRHALGTWNLYSLEGRGSASRAEGGVAAAPAPPPSPDSDFEDFDLGTGDDRDSGFLGVEGVQDPSQFAAVGGNSTGSVFNWPEQVRGEVPMHWPYDALVDIDRCFRSGGSCTCPGPRVNLNLERPLPPSGWRQVQRGPIGKVSDAAQEKEEAHRRSLLEILNWNKPSEDEKRLYWWL